MEFRQLRSFCKVAELGSFSRAAEALHLTQPALGLQIKNLEEELGMPLLTRHSRGVALTSQGALLLQHAEAILAGVNCAFRALKDFQTHIPTTIRIGMAPSLAAMLSVPLQRRAAATMNDLQLKLAEAPSQYLNDWVASGEVDLAIACEGPKHAEVEREQVLREALYLVQPAIPNEPAIGAPVEFADLADMPLLVADPLMSRQLIDKLQSAAVIAGVSLRIQTVLPSTALVKEAVEDGEGSTVLPYAVVKRDCEQKRLRVRRIIGPTLTRNAYLLSRLGRSQAPDIRNLVRGVIADEFRGAPEHGDVVQAA